MDNSSDRSSGIPRLSRLPVPRQASAIPRPASNATSRLATAQDKSVSGTSQELQNPKLRASTSRGQLRSGAAGVNGRDSPLRPVPSRDQIRSPAARASSTAKPKTQPGFAKPKVPGVASTPRRQASASSRTTPSQHLDTENVSAQTVANRDSGDAALPSPDGEPLSGSSAGRPPFDSEKPRSSKPRPSLAERTMETLAQLPSSPALSKKSSSFFENGRPRSRAESGNSRPGSSYNSDGSGRIPSRSSSRPGSRSDHDETGSVSFRQLANPFKSQLSTINGTPERTATDQTARTPSGRLSMGRGSLASASRMPPTAVADDRSLSPDKKSFNQTPSRTGSKTVAARPLKSRASANGLYKKPSLPALDGAAGRTDSSRRGSQASIQTQADPWDGSIPQSRPAKKAESGQSAASLTNRKSSTALRDQIAKAKAAKRAAMRQVSTEHVSSAQASSNQETRFESVGDEFDFGVEHDDPFNSKQGQDSKGMVLKQRVGAARSSGRLNIAALGLKEIPSEVMKMYDFDSVGGGSWAESVDLTRLIAADNELETLGDDVFPDCDPQAFDNEDSQGNIFGGLETLDLHGNKLLGVPLGLRRLPQLTSLNLSSNNLEMSCLEAVAQIVSLRDLKLANNRLSGELCTSLLDLTSLEILDLHNNKISSLPQKIEKITRLRILNLNENILASLPFGGFSQLPLTELSVRKNKLAGTLIQDPVEALPQLQTLDVALNQLTQLVAPGSNISLPVLHGLTLSVNRLQELPDMTVWPNLLILTADENSISSIPEGFTSLEKLRQADFSGNDIRVIPPEIARMESLSMIRLSGNPLRDRKFASATTDELKDMLSARLEPPPPYQEDGMQSTITELMGKVAEMDRKLANATTGSAGVDNFDGDSRSDDDFATPPQSPSRSRSHTMLKQAWPVKPGGLLDRSRTESSSLDPKISSETAAQHQVRQLQLHHNLFTSVPEELSFFARTLTSINISHNQLAGESYIGSDLSLPALREVSFSSNHITSLSPLVTHLKAPALDKIDVSLNRINALPLGLKETFPRLDVLLVANNQLSELRPETIKGLRIVDAASNDIAHLEPRIGLLGGQGGLQRLEVTGNRFKVPRWNILERGTESTLQWLRGRVPLEDMEIWRRENGEADDDDVD